jgi:hypothetical protein
MNTASGFAIFVSPVLTASGDNGGRVAPATSQAVTADLQTVRDIGRPSRGTLVLSPPLTSTLK